MNLASRAKAILRNAETSFAPLIDEAVRTRDFDSVKMLAALAERVQKIADGIGPADEEVPWGETILTADIEPGQPGSATASDYPQYRRDGEILIKIAWSKAFSRPYEHRVEKGTLELIVDFLAQTGRNRKSFRAQEVEQRAGDAPLPTYQVYAALSWLRWSGLITQHGRSGYSVVSPTKFEDSVSAAWNQLKPASTGTSPEVANGDPNA